MIRTFDDSNHGGVRDVLGLVFGEALTPNQKADCLNIRRIVFIKEQRVPEARELEGEDNSCCRHFFVQKKDEVIGTMRVTLEETIAKCERMAIVKSERGKGIGLQLLEYCLAILTKDPTIGSAQLNAQVQTLRFYQKAGFEKRGEPFIDAGITHYLMEKTLI